MKHVFFAHSHTLTLCSLGTIEYLNLPHKDCIFLCTRNYDMPDGLTDCSIVYFNDLFNEFNRDLPGSILNNIKDIDRFDKALMSITSNDKYCFYTPHLFGGIYTLIASHKKCRKVSFVQEGAYCVAGKFINYQNVFQKIFRFFLSFKRTGTFRQYACSGWYTDGCLPFQKKIDLYATTENFFQYMPREKCVYHKISWPQYSGDLFIEHPLSPIFIFDGYVKNGVVDRDIYMTACKRLIEENYSEHNYVKFHPAQSLEERKGIIAIFESLHVHWEQFTESKPFEFYIAGCKNLKVVGFASSLMYFAKDAGHSVIARTSWLLNSPLFKKEVENGYPIFDN